MLTKEELKQRACATIDAAKDEIIGVAKEILANPEPGFSEIKTARLVASKMDQLCGCRVPSLRLPLPELIINSAFLLPKILNAFIIPDSSAAWRSWESM